MRLPLNPNDCLKELNYLSTIRLVLAPGLGPRPGPRTGPSDPDPDPSDPDPDQSDSNFLVTDVDSYKKYVILKNSIIKLFLSFEFFLI